jgi:hypothetical protein
MEAKMKALFVSLAVLLFAFFLGCENSITDPAVSENTNSFATVNTETFASKDYTSTFPGYIELNARLDDPRSNFNSSVDLKGSIVYKIELVHPNDAFSRDLSAYKVSLKIDAVLKAGCPGDDDLWKVRDLSMNIIYRTDPQESVYYLDKSFRVQSKCPIPKDLVFRFEVNGKSLKVVSMQLKLAEGWVSTGDPES